ncbi:MAG: hypothetical protein ACRDKL_11450 [Solirubrobacteraceae bacterium]
MSAPSTRSRRFDPVAAYHHHMANPRRERAFLHAVGFTLGSVSCRATTHAIRAQRGPFRNLSVGGRHLHHCTFGILGQIGLAYLWTYQLGLGTDPRRRVASRVSAFSSGLATALTLDELALWFDLADDYWTPAGRKSIDALFVFGGVSAVALTGRDLLRECGHALAQLTRDHSPVGL